MEPKLAFITRDEIALMCRTSLLYALDAPEGEALSVRKMVRNTLTLLRPEHITVVLNAFAKRAALTPAWHDFVGELQTRIN